MEEREAWDKGEPETRSHEQYKKPEYAEPAPVEVAPDVPETESDVGETPTDETNEQETDGAAGEGQDLSALTDSSDDSES